ncbi:hypothetical protein L228DRAFT_270459 [Xylona heveae TC161]|uniref:Uncharacterized protein n=1 Tax=Xylona heveae (strain CBS 132557 / TC161) TaxID=1328760 RepID=A0A165AFD9_XYLHT|nr:hypothetical protein L228DRAFT_270459 [Xylona heveae TC161]KZF20386.1 hypothetical protein L228DRAFT_270459 [Xylona heveae TC161]
MVDFRGPAASMPHRKPVPVHRHSASKLAPLTQIVPDSQQTAAGRQSMSSASGRSRGSPAYYASQSPYPPPLQPSPLQPATASQQGATMTSTYQNPYAPTRRTLSNATASTSTTGSSGGGLIPARTNSSASASLRRSTSSRSGGGSSPTGYVALMRKQKATVWCDRTQHEDPRLLAQQKAAKVRATLEVVGGRNVPGTRTSTTSSMLGAGVRSRIRHHGAQKTVGYSTANLAGDGVPLRLSASEVGDEDADDNNQPSPGGQRHHHHHHHQHHHHRSSSGRSSLGSNRRYSSLGLQAPAVSPGRFSQGSSGSLPGTRLSTGGPTPTSTGPVAELAETPASNGTREDYFNRPRSSFAGGSTGASSGSSSDYTPNPPAQRSDGATATSEELRRRGSVDDRTMTLSGVRLFVANPDLSD